MGSTRNAGDPDTRSQLRETLIDPINDSVLLKVATMGVLLFVSGWVLDVGFDEGVWAAIFGAWGVGLVLVGLSCYGFIWWQRR